MIKITANNQKLERGLIHMPIPVSPEFSKASKQTKDNNQKMIVVPQLNRSWRECMSVTCSKDK